MSSNKREVILVTGCAGFIGFHLCRTLIGECYDVIGIDNLNDYYDTELKKARLQILISKSGFTFYQKDIVDKYGIYEIFDSHRPKYVVNLAAQAGVRYSIKHPKRYMESNVIGFFSILEACREFEIEHLLFASSSSVYGGNTVTPFSTNHNVDHPVSLYAATKKSNELFAHSYSHIHGIPTTGMRFFTVYGPWGRPDMAYHSFTEKILLDEEIKLFNYGNMERDYTYIDDLVDAIVKLIPSVPQANKEWAEGTHDAGESFAPYKVHNIGGGRTINLNYFISILEELLGKKAERKLVEMQQGDVTVTYADISRLQNDIDYHPNTTLREGLSKFVEWYLNYYENRGGK